MLQLKNTTPFPAHITVLPDEKGVDTLYATLKASFTLGPALEVAGEQRPVLLADQYWGEPDRSSLKYAAEVHLAKPSTDVALVGQAHAVGRRPAAQLDASLSVDGRRKVVRVFGERAWRPLCWLFCLRRSAPRPFRAVPLTYEHAFGGIHQATGKRARVTFEPRNPVGMGFAGRRRRRELNGLPLPHLEDPAALIKSPRHRPAPAGFGFVAPSWEPRRSFAGTYDEAWQKRRAPYLPDDFDPRFLNAAHPDLVTERHLEGGERVEALNVSPHGPLRFRLPVCRFKATVRVAGRDQTPPLRLETVLIEPDDARLTMLWRGAVPCDKQALKVEEVALELHQLDLTGSR